MRLIGLFRDDAKLPGPFLNNLARIGLFLFFALFTPVTSFAEQFTAVSLGDYGNVTVMEVSGNYDADNPDKTVNAAPRQIIAKEFYKTHKDDYDFVVIFSNFDFAMPANEQASGFYTTIKNDTRGLGIDLVDNSSFYGSSGKLQGTIDMGNLSRLPADPLDPEFEETLGTFNHEIMHRWAAHAKFRDASGAVSSSLLGSDGSHWSFLLDSGASLMYGNQWQNNEDGTFTSLMPPREQKFYSSLDLYLMGMIDKSSVPSMLLIESPGVDANQLPQAGVTITGTARTVTIDDIIAAIGPRIPDASSSQKNFKTAFIFITQQGTFTGDDLYKIESIRNGAVTRFSILTSGNAIMQIASTPKDDIPTNPGVTPPSVAPRSTPPNLDEGVAWLMTAQRTDGSWQDLAQTIERDTAFATLVLRNFIAAQPNYQSGLQWLDRTQTGNLDYLARKTEALAGAGQDVALLVQDILSLQNADGGWGANEHYASGNADTALALLVLSATGYSEQTVLSRAINYLTSKQNAAGGWGSEDNGTMVQETSNVISALNKYRTVSRLDDAISRGAAWLISRQNVTTDGGFGNSPSTVYDTAVAVMTLRDLNVSTEITNKALAYLLGQQSGNGSWNNSAYETALAVDAVYRATVDPDLSIASADIAMMPAPITSLPSNIVVSVNIWNLGKTAVPQATVVLYDGSPASGKKIGQQAIAFPGQASTTIAFPVLVNDGNEHIYTVVVDPDNCIPESSEVNNQAAKTFTPQPTYDFEILTSNLTVSAGTVSFLQEVTVAATVTNHGTMNAYNVHVKYFIDDPAAPFEISTQTVDIPAGGTIANQVVWRADRAGVNMPLTVQVDPFTLFSELSKTNNNAVVPITVNADTWPNLAVSYKNIVATPSPAREAGSATLAALIQNNGLMPAENIKVNFYSGVPDVDGILLASRTIPSLASGASTTVSIAWQNIPEAGDRLIAVSIDPDNRLSEITRLDNVAFINLNILTLPDFTLSDNSIVFMPTAPKEGDAVAVTVTVQNEGEQGASNVVVRISDGDAFQEMQAISSIAGNATATVSFVYDTTGKKGAHTIFATIDPDNLILEQNENNNSASRVFGIQNANLWVTEQYFSPNGDGVKDSTRIFFSFDTAQTVTINVVNAKSEVVRRLGGPDVANALSGNAIWDGLDNEGRVVADGAYSLQLLSGQNSLLGSLLVTVDNNRSALSDAFGTDHLLRNNLTCMLPDITARLKWFPDESGLLFTMASEVYPDGLYAMGPDGQDIVRLVPSDWIASNVDGSIPLYLQPDAYYWSYYPNYEASPNGDKVAFVRQKYRNHVQWFPYATQYWVEDTSQLWIADRDGNHLFSVAPDENTWITEFTWSPDGSYLLYSKNGDLWITNSDGTDNRLYDIGAYSGVKWSPDATQFAYVVNTGAAEHIRTGDYQGNKREVFSEDLYWTRYFEWLDSQTIALMDSFSFRIIDASGAGNHREIDPFVSNMDIVVAPDKKSFIFTDYSNGCNSVFTTYYWGDFEGNIEPLYSFQPGTGCYQTHGSILWSPDSWKIAFSESSEQSECGGRCSALFDHRISIVDVATKIKTSYDSPLIPLAWLSDGLSLEGYAYSDFSEGFAVCDWTMESGETKCAATAVNTAPNGEIFSPRHQYIQYSQQVDSSSACYGNGYSDFWTMRSLLNLTSDLRATQGKSGIVLKGVAADLNFEGYQLEYADVTSPLNWSPIAPPSNVPVVNETFTTWVPPYEGAFYVQLRVWDRAGNAGISRKRVSWGHSSSITNLYTSLDLFSPNNDGQKDSVELHYRVLEPIHLEFTVYNEADVLVRTFYQDRAVPGEDFITWDGTDESGYTVPDGKYKLKIFDYEFFVEVDATPPDVNVVLSTITNNGAAMNVKIAGHGYDKHFKEWVLESGSGDNPDVWNMLQRGSDALVFRSRGNILQPIQDTSIASYGFSSKYAVCDTFPWYDLWQFEFPRGKKFRLTAEDFAGNKVTKTTSIIEEGLHLLFPGRWQDSLQNGNVCLWDDLAGNLHTHQLMWVTSVHRPIASMILQEQISGHWSDALTLPDPDATISAFEWKNSHDKPGLSAIRLKGIDDLGQQHYSNTFDVAPRFAIELTCDKSYYYNSQELLTTLKIQYQKPGEIEWHDLWVTSYPGGLFYEFYFNPSGLSYDLLKDGATYNVRMFGIGLSGREYISNSASYPPICPIALADTIGYEKGECGLIAPGKATIRAAVDAKSTRVLYLPIALSYFLETSEGMQLVRKIEQANLFSKSWEGAAVNTSEMQEGSYRVKAVLDYQDFFSGMEIQTSVSDTLYVDRVLPSASLTYPSGNSLQLCPIPMHDALSGDWYGIPVEAVIEDNSAVSRYELYYGHGGNPETWLQAMDPGKKSNENPSGWISGSSAARERIGTWDVSTLAGGTYTLKLKVIDRVGNVSCAYATFSFDSIVTILNLTADNRVISPNSDGVLDDTTVSYAVDKNSSIDVKVFKLVSDTFGAYALDATPVRTIASGMQYSGGTNRVLWDGKSSSGSAVPDDSYGVSLAATDFCGNTAQSWAGVIIDNTPPTVSIAYPHSGDPLGNIVEVRGSASDLHFKNATLEAGEGSFPETWSLISSKAGPVTDDVLGKWVTYGLEGIWTLRLTAVDVVGNKNVAAATVDLGLRKNLIKNLDALPRLFSPNNDGKRENTTIAYEIIDACTVLIECIDRYGAVKKTSAATAPSAGIYTYAWDGKDDAGTVVPDGVYTVRLTASLSANASMAQTETITVVLDATLPVIELKQPVEGSYSKTDLQVSGSISDLNLAEYEITYRGDSALTQIDIGNQDRTNYLFSSLNLADGLYTLTARAKDTAENNAEKNIVFTIDRTPPAVKLDTPKNGEYYGGMSSAVSSQVSASIFITGSIVEKNLETFSLRYGAGDSPAQWTDLATGNTVTAYPRQFTWSVGQNDAIPDGVYTLSLFAKDKAGSTGEMKVSRLVIDNTAPTAVITSLADGAYVTQAVEVIGTAFDQNLDKYALEMSEGQCSSAFKWAQFKSSTLPVQDGSLGVWQALPADGDYCVRLTALDKVGLKTESKVNVKVDTHPLAAPSLSGRVDARTNVRLDWILTTEPDLAGYNLYRNGVKVNAALISDSRYLDQALVEGVYTYSIKAQDLAGRESPASNEVKLKIDLTGPLARISSPRNGSRVSGLIEIKGTAAGGDDFKQYRVSCGQGTAPTTWVVLRSSPVPVTSGVLLTWDALGSAEGQVYSIRLEAEDLSGNITTSQISVTLDHTPPAAPVFLSASSNSADVSLAWQPNAEADLAGYLLFRNDQLANVSGVVVGDLKPYLISTSSTTYNDTSLPDGTFRYFLMAMDLAGNISGQSNTLEVTIDLHPAHATIIAPADGLRIGNTILVKAESPDQDIASVQFQYQDLQNASWTDIGIAATSASLATSFNPAALGLAYGEYRLRAVATDNGQRIDPEPGFITIIYADTMPPTAPVGLHGLVTSTTVSLAWTPNTEADLAGYNIYRIAEGVRAQVNTELVSAAPLLPYLESGLADGSYAYTVTAVDTFGNESQPSNSITAIVYAPTLTQPYTPVDRNTVRVFGRNSAANAIVSLFTYTDSSPVSAGTITADASGAFTASVPLTPGENRIFVRALDSLDNVSRDSDVIVVVKNGTPDAPGAFTALPHDRDVRLTWDSNPEPDILGYNLFRNKVKVNASDAVSPSQATISASSWYDSYLNAPESGMDSSLASYWRPRDGVGIDHPAWWEIDLPAPELISRLELQWGDDHDLSGNHLLYAGKDYEIQVWSGYAWVTQAAVTGNAAQNNIFNFKPSYRTERIRIFITDSTDAASEKQVRLAEVGILKDNLIPFEATSSHYYDDLNLRNNTYLYTLTTVDNYGFESLPTSTVQGEVSVAPPAQSTGLSISPLYDGALYASWTYDGLPAAGFNLYRSVTVGGPYAKVSDTLISTTSYLDAALRSGITYFYVVAAVDAAGNEGAYSDEAQGTSQSTIIPSKPVLFYPTIPGRPMSFGVPEATIIGEADPDAVVILYRDDGTEAGRASAAQQLEHQETSLIDYAGYDAVLSPNRKMLAYTGVKLGERGSYLLNLASKQVTVHPNDREEPQWSPEGNKILYYRRNSNYLDIYDVATETFTRLTDGAFSEYHGVWSPDGVKVVFESDRGGAVDLWVKDLNTGALSQVSQNGGVNPAWSPDGTQIAYNSGGTLMLLSVHDGTERTLGSNAPAEIRWSPDGKNLCFLNSDDGQIYVVNADTADIVMVSDNVARYSSPRWLLSGKVIYLTEDLHTVYASDTVFTNPSILLSNAGFKNLVVHPSGSITYCDADTHRFITLSLAGRFEADRTPLLAGENIVSAVAVNNAGNVGPASDPITIVYDKTRLADLLISAEEVYPYPSAPVLGEQMSINVVVRNAGNMDASNVDIAVYIWNAQNKLELLKFETIPIMAAQESLLIQAIWDSAGMTGENRIVVVVDPDDTIAESEEANNMTIHDFFVADTAGLSLSTTMDGTQYSAGCNANITLTIRNSGPDSNVTLFVTIEDENGYQVASFDPKSLSLAYAASSVQSFVWNTGAAYAGSYTVHAVFRDASDALVAENVIPFTVLPDSAINLNVLTDKIGYGPGENVFTSFTIKNTGMNYIIPELQITLSILDANGSALFSDTKTAAVFLPGMSVEYTSSWNTGINAPGDYRATVVVEFENGVTTTKTAAFKINPSFILTGSITASPQVVSVGSDARFIYWLANAGNADASGFVARIKVIDPATQTVLATHDDSMDLAKNSSANSQLILNTAGYALRTYTAVLQAISQAVTKTVASTSFTLIDLTPPVVIVNSPLPNTIYNGDLSLSVLASDKTSGVESVEYQRDNSDWKRLALADPSRGRHAGSWRPTSADNGGHTFRFRARDREGNTSAPVSISITVQIGIDNTPPVLMLSTLPDGALTNNATLNITGIATDNRAVQSVTINDALVTINADNSFSHALQLIIGSNTITTVAMDTADNTTTDVRTIVFDPTVPVITISQPMDNSFTNHADIIVSGMVDKLAKVSMKVNGISTLPEIETGSSFTFPATLARGQNTIEIMAVDPALNSAMAKRTVVFDSISPALAIISPGQDLSTNQSSILLQGTAADLTEMMVTVTMDGKTYSPAVVNNTFEQQLNFIEEKQYQAIVTAIDAVGNSSIAQRNIIYDKTPPVLSIDPVRTPTSNSRQVVRGTRESGSTLTVVCPIAAVGLISYPTDTTWQVLVAGMAEGRNVIRAAAADKTGNISSPVNAAILLDTQAPVTTPDPAPGVYNATVSITLRANESAKIYYTTDDTVPTKNSTLYAGPIAATVSTTIRFFAVDAAGNREAVKQAAYTINTDIEPPVTSITVGNPKYLAPDGRLFVSATAFSLSASDDASGVARTEYRIDKGPWTVYTGLFMVPNEGKHTIGYRSIDNRNNQENEKLFGVVVDTSPPVSTIQVSGSNHSGSRNGLHSAGLELTLTAADGGSGLKTNEYSIDGEAWSLYTGPVTLTRYASGRHSIGYRSTDNLDNKEAARIIFTDVARKKSIVTYDGPVYIAQGYPAILSATLRTRSGSPLPGLPVLLTLYSGAREQACTGMTDENGKASCTISHVTGEPGHTRVLASFGGNGSYLSASDHRNVLIFGFPLKGFFVIGDRNAEIDRTVIFWGDQWSKKNRLSRSKTPDFFEGYADAANGEIGGTWSADLGHAAHPPAGIPAYLGVLVSKSITKEGDTLIGTVEQILVIRTLPGYGRNPGQAGTGTVIGVYR